MPVDKEAFFAVRPGHSAPLAVAPGIQAEFEVQPCIRSFITALLDCDRRLYVNDGKSFHTEGVVICHTHPSGSSEPSESDILATCQLGYILATMGFSLVDHWILYPTPSGNCGIYSFRMNFPSALEPYVQFSSGGCQNDGQRPAAD